MGIGSDLMQASDTLAVGQTIRIHTADRKFQEVGKIEEMAEDALAVRLDMDDLSYCSAPTADTVLFMSATGENCVYRFLVKFHGCSPLPDKIWYADMPEKVQRQQKRKFVRVPLGWVNGIRVKLPNGVGSFQNYRTMTLLDISGGGVCFVSDEEIMPGVPIRIETDELPGFGRLRTSATVRRCMKVRVLDHVVYHIGVCMEGHLDEFQQDALIKSIFTLQQMSLKKGIRL